MYLITGEKDKFLGFKCNTFCFSCTIDESLKFYDEDSAKKFLHILPNLIAVRCDNSEIFKVEGGVPNVTGPFITKIIEDEKLVKTTIGNIKKHCSDWTEFCRITGINLRYFEEGYNPNYEIGLTFDEYERIGFEFDHLGKIKSNSTSVDYMMKEDFKVIAKTLNDFKDKCIIELLNCKLSKDYNKDLLEIKTSNNHPNYQGYYYNEKILFEINYKNGKFEIVHW
jgi:hypothetical protein